MLLVCCYCRRTIREDDASGAPGAVSHGICPPCAEHFERLWDGMTLSEYLDTLAHPTLVVNPQGRILAASRQVAGRFGHERRELPGLLQGEALACERSRLPGGCGKTVHCRECTIRRSVESVAESGVPVERVPAYLETDAGCVKLRVSARARKGVVEVVLEEVEEARAPLARKPADGEAA
jgi:hypothetical protein